MPYIMYEDKNQLLNINGKKCVSQKIPITFSQGCTFIQWPIVEMCKTMGVTEMLYIV